MKQITLDIGSLEKSLQAIEDNMVKYGPQAVYRLGFSEVLAAMKLAEEIREKLSKLKEMTK